MTTISIRELHLSTGHMEAIESKYDSGIRPGLERW